MRGAGVSCSAAAWRAISAGRDPLVSMPISTRRTPGRRCRDLGLDRCPGIDAAAHRCLMLAEDRPARVPEIEARLAAHRVLLRGGERRKRADVAPVGALL